MQFGKGRRNAANKKSGKTPGKAQKTIDKGELGLL